MRSKTSIIKCMSSLLFYNNKKNIVVNIVKK